MPSLSFSTITANFKIGHSRELINALTKIFLSTCKMSIVLGLTNRGVGI